jgi:hypothetical protein
MNIEERIEQLLAQQYEPALSLEDATEATSTVRLTESIQRLYHDATMELVQKVMHRLEYKVWDRGNLDFVWLMRERPLRSTGVAASSPNDSEGLAE